MRLNNYFKVTVRALCSLHDVESVRRAPSSSTWPLLPHDCGTRGDGEARQFVTTWTFAFDSTNRASMTRALERAQDKRRKLRMKYFALPASAFQLSSFAPCEMGASMGVSVVGTPIIRHTVGADDDEVLS